MNRSEIEILRNKFQEARDSGDVIRVAEYSKVLATKYEELGLKSDARRFTLLASLANEQLKASPPQNYIDREVSPGNQILSIRIPDFALTAVLQFLSERTGLVTVILDDQPGRKFGKASLYLEEGLLVRCDLEGPGLRSPNSDLRDQLCEVLRLDLEEEKGEVTFRSLKKAEVENLGGRIPFDQARALAGLIFEGFTAIDESDREDGPGAAAAW